MESKQYTVVARRYRPQSFGDLVGQGHVAHALSGAINQNRIGHAYLFTGARGVGKTSSARIFAKCLNCKQGPTDAPCNDCDICQSVSVGEDIDVLEIDGASNRGIDEIRQLRSNAIVRPSRARFKIYIIDEVHMLTQQAFNALLKTLEEPPDHVKFIFCTTDPQKIPITVLSRCQRFDFLPVQSAEIVSRLNEICQAEGITAEPDALKVLARRAAGSMRDSQSLLEQLFSFCPDSISVDDVNQLLGTADTGRVAAVASALIQHDSAAALNGLSEAIEAGVDSGQLASQLLGYFRDLMAVRVGAKPETLLTCEPSDVAELKPQADQLGLETTLSIVQLLDQCLTRMQSSLHARTLLEVAIVRICNLENLDLLADLVQQLDKAGSPGTAAPGNVRPSSSSAKKKEVADVNRPASTASTVVGESVGDALPKFELTNANLKKIWAAAASSLGAIAVDMYGNHQSLVLGKENRIVVSFSDRHVWEFCRRSDRVKDLEAAISTIVNQPAKTELRLDQADESTKQPPEPKLTRVQMIRQLEKNPMIKNAIEVFDAEVVDFRKK